MIINDWSAKCPFDAHSLRPIERMRLEECRKRRGANQVSVGKWIRNDMIIRNFFFGGRTALYWGKGKVGGDKECGVRIRAFQNRRQGWTALHQV